MNHSSASLYKIVWPVLIMCVIQLGMVPAVIAGEVFSVPPVEAGEVSSLSLSEVQGPNKNFSATYRYSHKPSSTILDEARLRVSKAGVRIDQSIDRSTSSIIANFESDRLWFLDRKRQLVHEVPLSILPDEASAPSGVNDSSLLGFIQYRPCGALSGQFKERIDQHGQVVEHWVCHVDGELIEQQWFSTDYGVVVLSMTVDGFVSELLELRTRQFAADYFIPPASYRSASIEELITGVMPIGSFVERTDAR